MQRRVNFDTWQKVAQGDAAKLGTFPEESFDTVVGKLLIPDRAYSGFQTIASGPAEITVGAGWLMDLGRIYFNDTEGGTTIDLLAKLPAATKKIVTVVAWGQEIETKLEPRTFLTDPDTRATVARATATEIWRWANLDVVAGVEGPDPQPPAVASNVLAIAYVTLTTAGVESVAMVTENQSPTLRGNANRLNELDIWRGLIGTRLETLSSDMLALAARLFGLARWDIVRQAIADVARIKDQLRLPASFTSYAADHFLDESASDTAHVDWLARIEEGIRFPPAAGFDAQLGLLNPFDELVIQSNFVLLPHWSLSTWVTNTAFDAEVSISQYGYQSVDMVQKTMSRQRTRYGTPFTICTNTQFWQTGAFDYVNYTFNRGGETFEVMSELDLNDTPGWQWGHHPVFRLRQVWYDTFEDPYWDRVVTNFSVNGAIVAESHANSQDGWLAAVDLFFSRVALTGNVTLFVVEYSNGQPDFEKVIAQTTVNAADLKVANVANPQPTTFNFQPTYLRKGHYAFVVVTAGNHYLWISKNASTQGTFFYSTDGGLWFQGSLTDDLCWRLKFCQFDNLQTTVQLQPLQLVGGIAAIDINADTVVPPGTQLDYQVQVAGVWHSLDNVDGGPSVVLNGLPPLLPFRAVFTGSSPFLQPALGVAANSRVTTWRPRADFRHISAIRTMPAPVTHITADVRLEAWRGAPYHTFTAKLLTGAAYATVTLPGTTTEEPAPDDPANAIIRHYTWTIGAVSSFRLRLEGTTDNVLTTFHAAERLDIDTP